MTNSSPLGVGQAPVENSWGTKKTKNVAQKKLALKGTFRLIPYLQKNGVYPPWTYLSKTWTAKVGVLTNAKIEVFNFRNKKSHVEKFYSFQYFVDFSTALDSPDLKFFRTGPRFAHIFEQHFQNLLSARKKKVF